MGPKAGVVGHKFGGAGGVRVVKLSLSLVRNSDWRVMDQLPALLVTPIELKIAL